MLDRLLLLLFACLLSFALAYKMFREPPQPPPTPTPVPTATAVSTPTPIVPPTVKIPGPHANSVYEVVNSHPIDLIVQHLITDSGYLHLEYTKTVLALSSGVYHLKPIIELPSDFTGSMTLEANLPFSASIVGYDSP